MNFVKKCETEKIQIANSKSRINLKKQFQKHKLSKVDEGHSLEFDF